MEGNLLRLFPYMNDLIYALMNDQAAIQNLDFLRQLIAEARADVPYEDMQRLRMVQYQGAPMTTEPQEDR
jgi:hypothetical protein